MTPQEKMENRLTELQPRREEQLAKRIKAELEKDFVARIPNSNGHAFRYVFAGFLLGAAAMFLCMMCLTDRFTKVVVHEIVREIPVTDVAETSEGVSTHVDTVKLREIPDGNPWSVFRLLGIEPEKRYHETDLDKILERQRELANRPRSSTTHFVMRSSRPTHRENTGSHQTYREFLETHSQQFNL